MTTHNRDSLVCVASLAAAFLLLASLGCGSDPPTAPTPPVDRVDTPVSAVTPDPPTDGPEAPETCATALDIRERDVSGTEHAGFTLGTTATCARIVAVSDADWLSVDNAGWDCIYSHPNNCRTTYGVQTNRTGAERFAVITIEGLPGVSKRVRQAAQRDVASPQTPTTGPTGPTPSPAACGTWPIGNSYSSPRGVSAMRVGGGNVRISVGNYNLPPDLSDSRVVGYAFEAGRLRLDSTVVDWYGTIQSISIGGATVALSESATHVRVWACIRYQGLSLRSLNKVARISEQGPPSDGARIR